MSSSSLIDQYANYPFDSDDAFKQGLAGIISRNSGDVDQNEIARKARVFYFNRMTGGDLTIEQVAALEDATHGTETKKPENSKGTETSVPEQHPGPEEPQVLTLAQIQEFIETGRTDQLPNNKIIPGGLNEAPPTESVAPARKKPWEVDVEAK